MSFFNTLKDSIYSPSFYASVSSLSFWKGFRYLLLLFLILSIIQTIVTSLSLGNIQGELSKFMSTAINYYPAELELKIDKGQVSTNVEEPYYFPMPAEAEGESEEQLPTNLVVIDTTTQFSTEQFNKYDTVVWITKDTVHYRDDYKIDSIPLNEVDNIIINRQIIESYGKQIEPYLGYVKPILVTLIFILSFAGYEWNLFYLLLLALAIMLLLKILKWNLEYSSAYKIGMYAITLPLLLSFLINVTSTYTNFSGFPFLFSLVTLAVVFANFFDQKPPAQAQTEAASGKLSDEIK